MNSTAFLLNSKLNDVRKIICLKKIRSLCFKKKKETFLISLKNWWSRIYTVCYTPIKMMSSKYHHSIYDVTLMSVMSSGRHSAKGLSKTFGNSKAAMVTDLWCHWCRSMADSVKSLKIWWSMAEIPRARVGRPQTS